MNHSDGIITGTVTSINTLLACFEIERIVKVHMGILITQGKIEKLPQIGSKVSIKNAHKFGLSYVVCKNSIIEGNFLVECPLNPYLNLINIYKLGSTDLVAFEEISNTIQKNFSLDEEMKMNILISLLQNIIFLKMSGSFILGREHCMNSIISNTTIKTIRTSKYVEVKTDKYNDFPYWSFGVHLAKKNVMIFGYLEIHPLYGFYMIKDSYYQMVFVITKSYDQIPRLQNSYVLIEKYTVITEIFSECKVPNVEYIIANVDDIHVIYSTKEDHNLFGSKSVDLQYSNVISFVLLRKSSICVGSSNLPELQLQVFLRFHSNELFWKEVYLILSSSHVNHNFLIEGSLYVMYFNTPLREVNNYELTRVKNLKIFEVQDQACYIEKVDVGMFHIPRPLTIIECKFHLQSCTKLISFQGIVQRKTFINPLPSRTVKNSRIYGFGTPGQKVHQIVFSQTDNTGTIYLDCYLNNWENILMPLGLVPQMEVIVRHVVPQSKKYLKSTIFTTFEVIAYKPVVSFNTVNLYKNLKEDWGIPCYLSQGHKIPDYILVWGKVFSIFILNIRIVSRCCQCKQIVNNTIHCHICKQTEREVEFSAKFNILDQYGQSSVMTKSMEVLQAFVNLRFPDFANWIASFQQIGTYTYNYFDVGSPTYEDLTTYMEKINEKKVFLELKCRKLKNSSSKALQKPSWECIEARRI